MPSNYLDVGAQLLSKDVGAYEIQSGGGGTTTTLTASQGTYTVTGQSVTLTYTSSLVASAGSYTVSGQAATLSSSNGVVANTGVYTVTGNSAALTYTSSVSAQTGAYIVSGQAATLLSGSTLAVETGSYSVSGQSANLLSSLSIIANTGSYTVFGWPANLTNTQQPDVIQGGGKTRWLEGYEKLYKDPKSDTHLKGYDKHFPNSHREEIKHSASILSKAGGHARAESLTAKQRSSIASTAAKARWRGK